MEKSKASKENQSLLPMLALLAFVVLALSVFAVGPVYAPGPVQPDQQDPGDGGGGPNPCTIEGRVLDYDTQLGINHTLVCLYWLPIMQWQFTDVSGWFYFSTSFIYPNSDYLITVNGQEADLGYYLGNKQYGQRKTIVHTDSWCSAYKEISLQKSTIVNVTVAALFSNTKFATLNYEQIESRTVSHGLSFSAQAGLSYSVGYSTSDTATFTLSFQCKPLEGVSLKKRCYAASYYDDTSATPGVKKTGISGPVANHLFSLQLSQEYLSPNDTQVSPNLAYFDCYRVPPFTLSYEETGSYTLTYGSGFALSYYHYGMNLNLETTVSATATNKVDTTIDRYIDDNPADLTFAMYTGGFKLTDPEGENPKGGLELHIWNMDGAG